MYYNKTAVIPETSPIWKIDVSRMDLEEGGFSLVASELNFDKLWAYQGAFLSLDYSTRLAHIQKTATVIAGSTTTKTRVSKNNLFNIGDVVGKTGANAVAITAIDTSNDDYDVLTHLTNGAALSAGDVLIEAAAVGSDAAAKYTVDGLLNDTTRLRGTPSVTAKVTGFPYIKTDNLSYPITDAIKSDLSHFRFI